VANTQIDPGTLVGAKSKTWALLKNATIKFTRVVATDGADSMGNPKPSETETLIVPAYFKKARLVNDVGRGVPIGSYSVEGYTVGILPDWANTPSASELPCIIDHLGEGTFVFQGKIHVAKEQVEQAGSGSQVQGYFVIQGGG
jgi:hypothetical protein